MITFKCVCFTFVVYVSNTVIMLATDIILNINESGIFYIYILHIGSRQFELFSKEVHVKKQLRKSLWLVHTMSTSTDWRVSGLFFPYYPNCL